MTKIEKMRKYIDLTKLPKNHAESYGTDLGQLREIWSAAQIDPCSALCLLFDYGKAKGYRAAKAEATHGR